MIRFPLSIRGIGGFLVFIGLLSCVLHLIGFNLRVLLWVDLWGPAIGWLIRLGVVAIGAAMFLLLKKPRIRHRSCPNSRVFSSITTGVPRKHATPSTPRPIPWA